MTRIFVKTKNYFLFCHFKLDMTLLRTKNNLLKPDSYLSEMPMQGKKIGIVLITLVSAAEKRTKYLLAKEGRNKLF